MVGLVVVSHSRALARAAAALAAEMPGTAEVPIEIAAGLAETTLGTDATAIADAMTSADRGDGVVVLMDLGSAVLSADLARELLADDTARDRVLLCAAPLVEGLIAAAVAAASGATRAEVAAEANAALHAKQTQLGVTPDGTGSRADPPFAGEETGTVPVTNPHGLHARPAARLVTEARRFDARVEIRNRTTGSSWAPATSLTRVATLGVRQGHEIELRASGTQAHQAIAELTALAERQFDEPSAGPPPDDRHARAASPGIALGPAAFPVVETRPDDPGDDDPRAAWRSVEEAVAAAQREISAVRDGAGSEAGIFEAHLLLLDDAELLGDVQARIERGVPAARAVTEAGERVAEQFGALGDAYLRGRAADVRAVAGQVVRHLGGGVPAVRDVDGVLVAADLGPADVAGLDTDRVSGVLLTGGSPSSHAAIIARARAIPMVTGAGALDVAPGTPIALDGATGEFVVDPDDDVRRDFRERAAADVRRRETAASRAAGPATTQDGVTIAVAANIGSLADAKAAAQHGADLAGLVRTEFLFLDRDVAPGPDEQLAAYEQIAEALDGRRLVLRTVDVGGDKPLRYAPATPERNPFLGVRGIRHSLAHPRLLADQLLAFVRLAARGVPVSVMFPMVTSVAELRAARRILDDASPRRPIEVGIMVEVPAAALKIATFRPWVDFVSIGTNDLTQYTLAAERGNPAVPADGLDPAVLRLVQHVCRNAGVPVAVCGELAADETAVPVLIGLGVRELSVAPPAVPLVKEAVRACTRPAVLDLLEREDAGAVRAAHDQSGRASR